MLGDILASFLAPDRAPARRDVPRSDQLDFVVVSLPLTALLATEWFLEVFTLGVILVVVVLTPILHVTTNVIAYKLGLKTNPGDTWYDRFFAEGDCERVPLPSYRSGRRFHPRPFTTVIRTHTTKQNPRTTKTIGKYGSDSGPCTVQYIAAAVTPRTAK